MNNTKKERISTGKKVIYAIAIIIAIVFVYGMIYGIVNANSMILFQSLALAACDTSIILLNNRNVKKEREENKSK